MWVERMKWFVLFFLCVPAVTVLTGCTADDKENVPEARGSMDEMLRDAGEDASESSETGMSMDFEMEIPGFLDRNEASLEPYPELEELLIEHYGLTSSQCAETRYYYNKIDLNDDGMEEILVVLLGPHTTGESGSVGSLVVQGVKGLRVEKDFTQLNLPVLISNESHEGWRDLVLCVGDGNSGYHYMALTYKEGSYGMGAQPVASLDDIDGTVYLCNDLTEDSRTGNFLVLGQSLEYQTEK